jgi:hypothetical protein
LTWTGPPRAGIAGDRLVKVLGAGNHGVFNLASCPNACQSTVI